MFLYVYLYVFFYYFFKKFLNERAVEEKKLDEEVKEEWENKLQAIHAQYEQDLKRKRDQMDQKVTKRLIFFKLNIQ